MSDEQITPDEGTAAPAPGGTAGAGGPSRRGLLKAGTIPPPGSVSPPHHHHPAHHH